MLCNLLSKALKFSNSAEAVSIEVEARADVCAVIVRDRGIGIPATLPPRLYYLASPRPGWARRENMAPGSGYRSRSVCSNATEA